MKIIKPSANPQQWPRHATKTIETRKRDLVVRISDWTKDKDEPAYDVEIYIGGTYDWDQSATFCLNGNRTQARADAVAFANEKIAALL